MLCCSCTLSNATVNVTPGVCQSGGCCGDGGASNVSSALNAVGRWGTILASTLQNKPVVVGNRGGIAVGPTGAQSPFSQNSLGGHMGMLIIFAIIIIIVLLFLRK
jgi:hypothetical protein